MFISTRWFAKLSTCGRRYNQTLVPKTTTRKPSIFPSEKNQRKSYWIRSNKTFIFSCVQSSVKIWRGFLNAVIKTASTRRHPLSVPVIQEFRPMMNASVQESIGRLSKKGLDDVEQDNKSYALLSRQQQMSTSRESFTLFNRSRDCVPTFLFDLNPKAFLNGHSILFSHRESQL